MYESEEAKKNTVAAEGQLKPNQFVTINKSSNAKLRVLFIGNSITRHSPAPQIGWTGDWGMAASCEANDYVHQAVRMITERCGNIDYCVAQLAKWEANYTDGKAVLDEFYQSVKDFKADIVIVRIAENINRKTNESISCEPYFDEMIKYFVTDECKQVIVTDCFWRIDVLNEIIHRIIEKNNYTFAPICDLSTDKATMAIGEYEHEGVASHPSDYGMLKIAERIVEKINV